MAEELRAEATGETVGEAKWSALRELERLAPGLDRAAVRFEVLAEGERGLLGVGFAPARVVAVAPAPARESGAPVEEAEAHGGREGEPGAGGAGDRVHDLLARIAAELGVSLHVDVAREGDSLVATCSGRELGLLIGRHGQTIDAVQHLLNAIVAREYPGEVREVVVDAGGYRERRRTVVEALAERAAEHALRTGERVELEPMTAGERKLVHLRLRDVPEVETSSAGIEPNRFVVVQPASGEATGSAGGG